MALGEAASELIGASAPVGEWDPAGLSKGKDAETMAWYRAAEIKHGRVCMLAAVGILVQGTLLVASCFKNERLSCNSDPALCQPAQATSSSPTPSSPMPSLLMPLCRCILSARALCGKS
jgi:hypothetical protein